MKKRTRKKLAIIVTVLMVLFAVCILLILEAYKEEGRNLKLINQLYPNDRPPNCEQLDGNWEPYMGAYDETPFPLQFCVKETWDPSITFKSSENIATSKGEIYYISLSRSSNTPLITIESEDFFQNLDDTDVGGGEFCWNEDQTELMNGACAEIVSEIDLNGKRGTLTRIKAVDPLSQDHVESISYEFNNLVDGYSLKAFTFNSPQLTEVMIDEINQLVESIRVL